MLFFELYGKTAVIYWGIGYDVWGQNAGGGPLWKFLVQDSTGPSDDGGGACAGLGQC